MEFKDGVDVLLPEQSLSTLVRLAAGRAWKLACGILSDIAASPWLYAFAVVSLVGCYLIFRKATSMMGTVCGSNPSA